MTETAGIGKCCPAVEFEGDYGVFASSLYPVWRSHTRSFRLCHKGLASTDPQGVGNDGQILISLEVRAHAPKHFELVEDIHIVVHHKKMLKLILANFG